MTIVNWEKAETMPTGGRKKIKRACEFLNLDFGRMITHFDDRRRHYAGPGGILRMARERLAMTQEEVAAKVGINESTLAKWERSGGNSRQWSHEKLNRLCRLLHIESTAMHSRRGKTALDVSFNTPVHTECLGSNCQKGKAEFGDVMLSHSIPSRGGVAVTTEIRAMWIDMPIPRHLLPIDHKAQLTA